MPIERLHFRPEHGLQIEETHTAGDKNGVYHLFRYWWAYLVAGDIAVTKQTAIWDLGCGCGFGCRILAELPGAMVTGFDGDEMALKSAKSHHPHERIVYLPSDLNRMAEKSSMFGLAVAHPPRVMTCFDTIEFLTHRELFLIGVVNHMPDDGVFLFSTPVNGVAVDYKPEWSAKHVCYTQLTIEALLRRFFATVIHSHDEGFAHNAYRLKVNEHVGDYTVGDNLYYCADPIKHKGPLNAGR
jgi:2-polyprenyl-3-methyl-5-hydroxy-6-metoxy-1,4-benzoquinol methylase